MRYFAKRQSLLYLCIATILLLAACGPGTATPTPGGTTGRGFALDWYVESSGSDSNNCSDPSSPCQSLRGAFTKIYNEERDLADEYPDLLGVNHTVHIGPGTFTSSMAGSLVNMSGWTVSIIGSGSSATILDGTGTLGGVLVNSGGDVTIRGLTVQNTIRASASGCIDVRSDYDVLVEDVILQNCFRSGLSHSGDGQVELVDVRIHNAVDENTDPTFTLNGSGVENYGGGMVISGGEISGNEAYGIYSTSELSVTGTTIRDNQETGLFISYTGPTDLANVTITNNGLSGRGAGLQILRGVVTLADSHFTANSNRAININGGILRMDSSTIGAHTDGAIIIYAEAVVEMTDVEVSEIGAPGEWGAVIWNYGNLTLTGANLHDNGHVALYNDGPRAFAAIYDSQFRGNLANDNVVRNLGAATLLLSSTLIAENQTGTGEAITSSSPLTMVNVTISGNSNAGLRTRGEFDVSYTTIADNDGTGYFAEGATGANVANVIVARNGGGDCLYELALAGSLSLGTNVDSDGSCGVSATHSDPTLGLGPLADNGGPSFTHALDPVSPAANIATGRCPSIDQRNYSRPFGPGCDLGAFEAGATALSLEADEAEEDIDLATAEPADDDSLIVIPNQNYNCRYGNSSAFDIADTLLQGQEYLPVGIGPDSLWLQFEGPAFGELCWAPTAGFVLWLNGRQIQVDQLPASLLRVINYPPLPPTATPTPDPDESYDVTPTPSPTCDPQYQQCP